MRIGEVLAATRAKLSRRRISRSLSAVLVLSLVQVVAPVIVFPEQAAPKAVASTLFEDRTNFLQVNNWDGIAANHVPHINQSGLPITSNSSEIKLTPTENSKSGYLWNTQAVSLNRDFSISASYYFGEKNADGADGISFLLMPLGSWPNDGILGSTSSTADSSGMIKVFFDTYQNGIEIPDDHLQVISINSSGGYKDFTDDITTIGRPLLDTSGNVVGNVERSNPSVWFDYTIAWNQSSRRLTVYAGANANQVIYYTDISSAQQDLVNLNWGWVGNTGGANNDQAISNVVFHYQPVITANPSDVTVSSGSSVTLNANYSVTGNAQNGRWQYQDYGSSSWTTTSEAGLSYTFTPTRADTLRKYRYYIESNLNGLTYSSTSTAATITVVPNTTETDTALSASTNIYGNTTLTGAEELTPSSSDDFTMAAWVRPTDTCSPYRCTILSREGVVRLTIYQSRFGFVLWNGNSYEWKDLNFATFPLNQWTHIAITRSGTTVKVYMNGNEIASYAMTYSPQASNTLLYYVGNTHYLNEPFKGSIDEVKIWKSNRGSNIASDMNSNSSTSTNIVGYWSFNEGKETLAHNQVLNRSAGTDMTLNAANYWDANVVSEPSSTAAYTIRTFKRSYITAVGGWRAPANVTQFHTLVVAGGGAGGRADSTAYEAGGGGGGGVLTTKVTLTPQTIYSVQVGYGGIGEINTPTNGGDSVAFSLTAFGGGYGGYATGVGGNGGSGGGGTHNGTNGGTGVAGQGFAGQKPASAGWGGGGGGATGTPTDGKGGVGLTSNITGSNFVYGDGGGGGSYNGVSNLIGGSGNGGRGAYAINNGGSNAVTNSGGGGGGAYSSSSGYKGGNGGTGVVIIRWITAAKPIFTQPTIDTTTAGLTDTITVSANPATSLTRNYRWQSSNDTGTTWANIAIGTGSGMTTQTYTTPVLETSTGGIRYQYRVVVTDSDTVGLFITDTSVAVYIVVNPRITITGTYTIQKYGATHTDTFTVGATTGTGSKTITLFNGNRTGISWNTSLTNNAALTIATTLSPGTYYDTITATDTKGAATSLAINIVVSKADTITVTALARSDTYTGSVLNFTPSFTVVGLKNSDTATPSYYNYAGADNAGTSYGSTSTKPMNAGTYSITPVTPTSLLDSYTAVTIETATLTIYRATRTITVSAPASPMKYGETRTVTSTPSAGSSDGTINYATSTTDSCTVSSSTARAIKPSGTCSFTATISQGNNYLAATSSSGTTILAKADTLTVQVRNPVEMVYTGNAPASLPTVTVVGLAYTDAATATRLYSAPASAVGAPQIYVALTNSPSVPVDVETYTVSSDFNFTSGSSANYVNIVYETSTVKITRATQPALTMNLYGAIAGSPFLVVTNGGAGPGAITESVTAGGTALNCTVANHTLSNTSPANELKTCNIQITKAISRNYFSQSLSATVYFMPYVMNQEAQPAVSSGLGLVGKTSLTIDTTTPPVITSLSTYSAARGATIEINGAGFSAGTLVVKFWRNQLGGTPSSLTDTKITIVIPGGATTGKVFVGTVNGETFSEQSLTITP